MAVEIIETEIRSAQYEVLLEAARLVLRGEPAEIAGPSGADHSATANTATLAASGRRA